MNSLRKRNLYNCSQALSFLKSMRKKRQVRTFVNLCPKPVFLQNYTERTLTRKGMSEQNTPWRCLYKWLTSQHFCLRNSFSSINYSLPLVPSPSSPQETQRVLISRPLWDFTCINPLHPHYDHSHLTDEETQARNPRYLAPDAKLINSGTEMSIQAVWLQNVLFGVLPH